MGDHRIPSIPTSMVGLAEEVELGEGEEEDTLGEAVEMPVGVVVDPTMLETISI